MLYKNSTSTSIQLIQGDIRDAEEPFVVIGRDPALRDHFETRVGSPFRSDLSWLKHTQVEFTRAADRSLAVLRIRHRPRNRPRGFEEQIQRLRTEIEYPLAHAIAWCDAIRIAMCPFSCRHPEVVATSMVRMIWDISVAAFLNVPGAFKTVKPIQFKIYSTAGIQPLIDALATRQDCSIHQGWLFSLDVTCNRAKQARFFNRNGFRFRKLASGKNIVHKRPHKEPPQSDIGQ